MKRFLNILLVLFFAVSLSNCEAISDLADKLGIDKYLPSTDEDDFGVKAKDLGDGWDHIVNFYLDDSLAEKLTGDVGEVEISGLGTALSQVPTKLLVVAKAFEHPSNGKTYARFVFVAKIERDSIVIKKQTGFPTVNGEGRYGLFMADKISYVAGKAIDCNSKAKADIYVTNDSNRFIAITNSSGRYSYPSAQGAANAILADKDCPTPATAPTPAPGIDEDTGEIETNTKADSPVTDPATGNPVTPDTVEPGQCNGDPEASVTEAPEPTPAPGPEEGPQRPAAADENDCQNLTFTAEEMTKCNMILVRGTGTGLMDIDVMDSPDDVTNDSTGERQGSIEFLTADPGSDLTDTDANALMLSTGGGGASGNTVGSGVIIKSDLSGKSKINLTYSVLSQEYPIFSKGSAFNDTISVGIVTTSQTPRIIHKEAVGDIDSSTASESQFKDLSPSDPYYKEFATLAASTDRSNDHWNGLTAWNNKGADETGTAGAAIHTVALEIPEDYQDADAMIIITVEDLGDRWYDTSIILHGLAIEQ